MADIEDRFKPDGMLSTLNRMKNYGDERSKVLLAALASEAVMGKVLETLMPQYWQVFDKKWDMSFAAKTKVLEAFAIVPKHITEAANVVRAIRNEFAHDLTVEKLGDLDNKFKKKMQDYYERREFDPKDKHDDLGHVFESIALIATVGLSTYLPLVRDLKEAIRDPAFETKLRKRAEKRQKEQVKIILEHVQAPAPDRSEPFS